MDYQKLANKARYVILQAARATVVALDESPPSLSKDDLLRIARGCTDYKGGYDGAEYEAFQSGVATVVCALERADLRDSQTNALWQMGQKT